jgi:hypothetical protein
MLRSPRTDGTIPGGKMAKTNTLLIWENVPENTVLFLVPNTEITPEQRKMLQTCAGHYSNESGASEEVEDALEKVGDLLSKPDGLWCKFKLADEGYLTSDITAFCVTGCLM